jgi:hypothetical protein
MKLIAILSLSLSALSLSVNASPDRCKFNEIKGELFEFSHPQSIMIHHDAVDIVDKGTYPFWFSEANSDHPLKVDSYFGRMAKVQSSQPVKRVKENTFKDVREKLYVRYYSAVADNCEQVYVRVVENEFPNYFSKKINFVDRKFNFLEQERWVGISMIENQKALASKKISSVTVKPNGEGNVIFVDSTGSKAIKLKRYTTLKVLDVKRSPFYYRGEMLSNYGIEVMYQGDRGFINADYRYITNGNPLLDVDVEFLNPISFGKLAFGMSQSDVLLSLGMPNEAEIFPVYKTNTGYKTDYFGDLRKQDYDLIGYVHYWRYDGIDKPLVFNTEKVFREKIQKFSRFDALGLPDFMMEQ